MAKTIESDKLKLRREENQRMIEGVGKAVKKALLEHKRAGNPIAVWEDGRVVWIPAEEIDVTEEDAKG
jgi:hypothetical protein